MVEDIEGLRRREGELEAELARVRSDLDRVAARAGQDRTGVEDMLFEAANATRLPMTVSDPNRGDNPIVFVNRAFEEMSGYAAGEIVGRNCRFLQGPMTDATDVARVRDAIAARREVVVELLNYRKDGSTFLNELHVKPIFGADGAVRYFFGSQLDVTRLRVGEARLADSEERYRALFDAIEAGFTVVEMRYDARGTAIDYRFVEVNPAFEEQTGLRDAVGRWVSEMIPGLEQHWFDTYGEVARTGRPVRFESRAGALGRWFDVHALRIGEPERHHVAILFHDVTERRRAENLLQATAVERTTERDLVWRASRDLLVICGFDGRYQAANPAWSDLLGWPSNEIVGMRFDQLVHPDDLPGAEAAFGCLVDGDPLDGLDVRVRAFDGAYRWISWNAIPDGNRFTASGRDVTERKALEEQLRQSQKMEAVGQLTGGVAHDFNNLLTVIKSSTDLLRRPGLPDERRLRYVNAISETVDRAAKLTGQLLAFARRQNLRPTTFAVDRAVASVTDMVGTLTGARIRVETDVDRAAGRPGGGKGLNVRADQSQFETALINMVVNARDSMGGEGRLRIAVRATSAIPAVRAYPLQPGDFVAVSVTDTGVGIAPENLERIFEPFFTTKAVGQGTGLGLSQVFGFAKQSGGEVAVTSTRGEGTTFTMYLPRTDEAASDGDAASDAGPLPEGHGTRVLVVEDNEKVGAFAEQALRELGYETCWAMDAAEALAAIRGNVSRFDVVFSDVMMPGMNGVDLARTIREEVPAMPVLLTSGYSEVLAAGGTDGFDLLPKPYSVAGLSRALGRAVREGAARA